MDRNTIPDPQATGIRAGESKLGVGLSAHGTEGQAVCWRTQSSAAHG